MERPGDGREYYYIEYEVNFRFDGRMLLYECTIPTSGVFSKEEPSHGPSPFKVQGKTNAGAAFRIGES